MKVCSKCKQEKPLSEYGPHRLGRGRLRPSCRDCHRESNFEYYTANKEAITTKNLNNHYKRKYNLTTEEVKNAVAKQDSRCSICKVKDKLQVDHNHETGIVRGLICNRCNKGLGLFKDKLENLESAVMYLKESVLV